VLEVSKDNDDGLASFHFKFYQWDGGLILGSWVLKQDVICSAG